MIPFGPWLPDLPDFEHPGLVRADNVLPTAGGYIPCPSFVSDHLTGVAGLQQGAARFTAGIFPVLIFGVNGRIYSARLDAQNYSIRDVSGTDAPYNMAIGSPFFPATFSFVNFKTMLYAVGNTTFAAKKLDGDILTTGRFVDATGVLPSREMVAVSEFLVSHANGPILRWSGFDDPDNWVPGNNQSDTHTFYYNIAKIVGGDVGIIFTQRDIWRMSYAGVSQGVFQFDQISYHVGTEHPRSVVQFHDKIWFLSGSSFWELSDGITLREIGKEEIGRHVLDELIVADYVQGAYDVISDKVMWSYGSNDTNSDNPKILVYDRVLEKWSLMYSDQHTLVSSYATRTENYVFGITAAGNIKKLTGPPLTAYLETGEFGGDDTSTTMEVRPYIEGTADTVIEVLVGTRNKLTDPVVWTDPRQPDPMGKCNFRVHGRFKRLGFRIYSGFKHAIGYDVTPKFAGKR